MTRKALCREIQGVNQRLHLHETALKRTREKSILALKKINPLVLIATGLLAGAIVGSIGWRKLYSLAGMGMSSYPFLKSSASGWVGVSHD